MIKIRLISSVSSNTDFDSVRPGAAELLIGVECSRIRDSTWHVRYPLVTTRTKIELVDILGNYSTGLE